MDAQRDQEVLGEAEEERDERHGAGYVEHPISVRGHTLETGDAPTGVMTRPRVQPLLTVMLLP